MPSSITMNSVTVHPEGHIDVYWDDNQVSQFPSLAEMSEYTSQFDSNLDSTKAMAVAWKLARDAGFDGPQGVGSTYTFDLSDPNPFKVQ